MARTTQNLNVCWIGSQGWCCTVRFNVVPLKIIGRTAFFACSSLRNHLGNCLSTCVGTSAAAFFPIWMVRPAYLAPSCVSRALRRTVFACSSSAFANLKMFPAFFANAINHGSRSARLQFLRALPRTSICFPSYMSVRAGKLLPASGASQRNMPAPFNLSLESSHG